VVKPTREGSSMGVSVVKSEEGLDVAFEYAFKYDSTVLVEEYLRGLEFTCVVWGNENPAAMLPTEIVFEGDFFTYEGKYMPGRTQTITPARVTKEVIEMIRRISVDIYKLIGCVGYGRVDGFIVPKNKEELPKIHELTADCVDIYVSEPHTGTIMVPSSFVFQQASKFRIELDDRFTGKKISTPLTPRMLVEKIVELALDAYKNKKCLL
jgi:D-alanine-D-alanine ligase